MGNKSYVSHTLSQAYWNLGLECALRRAHGRCWNNFDDPICNQCRVYLRKYVNTDEKSVQLMMLHCDSEAQDDVVRNRGRWALLIAFIIGIILCFVWSYYQHKDDGKKIVSSAPAVSITPSASIHNDIERTLQRVATEYNRNVDTNGDGLSNYIDAAVLFYQYFPDKSKVCIELNYNTHVSPTFNHLFNVVLVNGVWRGVEPQTRATRSSSASYWMFDYWGSRYDPKYNEDQTVKYKKFAR